MTLPSDWNENQDSKIAESLKSILDDDNEQDWKIVGNPSRRGSLSSRALDGSSINHATNFISPSKSLTGSHRPDFQRRSSTCSEKQWGSFGGFQWESASIFDEQPPTAPRTPLPQAFEEHYFDSVLSSAHAPLNSPLPPGYNRQQRSFSFSMGQDTSLFGYDDPSIRSINSSSSSSAFLAPTMEEDENQRDNSLASFNNAYLRSRSQSSNTAFSSAYSPAGYWANRRSSMIVNSSSSTSSSSCLASTDTPKDLLSQRRMSQPLNNITEYSFPEIIPNGGPTYGSDSSASNSLGRSSPPSSLQPLSDILENTHLESNVPLSLLPEQPSTNHITGQQEATLAAAGKGVLLKKLPPHIPLFMVEFKSGRTEFYYVLDPLLSLHKGELVIVEADRGKDLGKVATDVLTVDQVHLLQQQQKNSKRSIIDEDRADETGSSGGNLKKTPDSYVKKIFRRALTEEVNMLFAKEQDELKALAVCLQKIKSRKMFMEVVDAEFQWDRRKLTFYFIAERRIDFRELVRELFKIYKTRIWMCAVNPSVPGRSNSSF